MNSTPPKINGALPNTSRLAVIVLAAMALGGSLLLFFFNPSTHRFYPVCQFHKLTGWNCPGCGGTRALYALLHGDVACALRDNALAVTVIGLLALRGSWFAVNRICGRKNGEFFPVKWLWPLLTLAIIFSVIRNLPAFAFLSP